jgi:hypothetical protein
VFSIVEKNNSNQLSTLLLEIYETRFIIIKLKLMNIVFKILILLFTALCCMQSSCKKDKRPPSELVTVNGQTFGCRVNGEPFIADKWDYGNNIPPVRIRFRYSSFSPPKLQVIAERSNSYIEVSLNSPFSTGNRVLKSTTRPYPIEGLPRDYGLYQKISPDKEYITNDTLGGYVNILSIDTINQRIEARFEFTGTERFSGEKVVITNGYCKNY